MPRRTQKLTWPHEGNVAEATGKLEVCALVLIVFFKSRFAWGLLVLIALAYGIIPHHMARVIEVVQRLNGTGG